ncbi:Acetyltransferase (GNAT) family protein [Microbacterium sp. 8M]|jgi:GNAT superfamily N-acetyltransferase|uniref:GNAT family N-acetyltransferase n=1 Tax=Microbacterium sp. 8M TaxID=2653153 RepID=UPI0012F36C08|nr:GNAT family N-acetyltransferase [Microbacterium sp. 8M]VXC16794.1 Acetyltransferase (GNAT) family protein [Microbacterium sp. 8M]
MKAVSDDVWMRAAVPADVDLVAALKERVLRQDLERLVGWDPARSRARVVEHFSTAHTRMILVDGAVAGTITLRPDEDALWLEMFYLDAAHQGRGIGTAVLRTVLAETPPERELRLQVLAGSAAQRLYERHGFVAEHEDGVDVWMRRVPGGSEPTGSAA